jgi:hypothetical protein
MKRCNIAMICRLFCHRLLERKASLFLLFWRGSLYRSESRSAVPLYSQPTYRNVVRSDGGCLLPLCGGVKRARVCSPHRQPDGVPLRREPDPLLQGPLALPIQVAARPPGQVGRKTSLLIVLVSLLQAAADLIRAQDRDSGEFRVEYRGRIAVEGGPPRSPCRRRLHFQ